MPSLVRTFKPPVADEEDDKADLDSGARQREGTGDEVDMAEKTLKNVLTSCLTSSDSSAKFHTEAGQELTYQDSVLSIRPSPEFARNQWHAAHSLPTAQEQRSLAADQRMDVDPSASTYASPQASSMHATTSFGVKLQSSWAG
ncbi:unnamed protein product [Tilletia controversa]|nr:unnamed protein product [Tilletia controversa]